MLKIRRKILLSYAVPHLLWLACAWLHYRETEGIDRKHILCTGLKIVYNLYYWDDFTTLVITREKSLRDYLFLYWRKFMSHLLTVDEAVAFRMTWNAYLVTTSPDKSWLGSMGFRSNSKFSNRLIEQIHHSLIDWMEFDVIQAKQYWCFTTTSDLSYFVYKYDLSTYPPSLPCH